MEPLVCDFYEYRCPEGLVVLGIKTVKPDGTVIIHGYEPTRLEDWVKKEPILMQQ